MYIRRVPYTFRCPSIPEEKIRKWVLLMLKKGERDKKNVGLWIDIKYGLHCNRFITCLDNLEYESMNTLAVNIRCVSGQKLINIIKGIVNLVGARFEIIKSVYTSALANITKETRAMFLKFQSVPDDAPGDCAAPAADILSFIFCFAPRPWFRWKVEKDMCCLT